MRSDNLMAPQQALEAGGAIFSTRSRALACSSPSPAQRDPKWEISIEPIHLCMPGLGGTRERNEEK